MSEWQDPGGELPAGRDLDARVALALWPEMRAWYDNLHGDDWVYGRTLESAECPLPKFSTDLALAWCAGVHTYERTGLSFRLCFAQQEQIGAMFYRAVPGDNVFEDAHEPRFEAVSDDAAEALCRAALKALSATACPPAR